MTSTIAPTKPAPLHTRGQAAAGLQAVVRVVARAVVVCSACADVVAIALAVAPADPWAAASLSSS